MRLRDWLKENNKSIHELALDCGFSRNTFHVAMKRQGWTESTLRAVYEATGGKVTPSDILLEKWQAESGGGEGGGEYITLDPDAPQGSGGGGGGSLHKSARGTISGPLYALAAQVEAHGL